jgi:mono/diheme cytochrome c family protein
MKRLLLSLLLVGGAAHAQPPAANGGKLFTERCGSCHMDRGWGTRNLSRRTGGDGLLANRTDLTPSVVEYVVRNGLGSMPHFRQSELPDPLLKEIAAFLSKGNKE